MGFRIYIKMVARPWFIHFDVIFDIFVLGSQSVLRLLTDCRIAWYARSSKLSVFLTISSLYFETSGLISGQTVPSLSMFI